MAGLIRPVFDRLGWPLTECRAEVVLECLRSLSGRLAFRLMGNPHHMGETVGLLLARWLLGRAGFLSDHVIIPLDAHQAWFRRKSDEETNPAASSQRADLLLVAFEPLTSTVHLTVVEVKLRDSLSTSDRAVLYRQMREQAENTTRCLRDRFDPDLYPEARADLLIIAKELATTLAFYIRRGQRYGLISPEVADLALRFIENLDAGYRLGLRSIGVVFERATTGSHVDEDEPGFQVHRFGADIARALFDEATYSCESLTNEEDDVSSSKKSSSRGPKENSAVRSQTNEFESFRTALGGTTSIFHARKLVSTEGLDASNAIESMHQSDLEHVTAATPRENTIEGASPTSPAVNVSKESTDSKSNKEEQAPTSVPGNGSPELSARLTSGMDRPEFLLGANEATSQFGVLGRFGDAKVAIDLSGCNTISLFGVQGFGKSYTLGVIAEMAVRQVAGINVLPAPLATVIFHYHKSDAYCPEFATAIAPNRKPREIEALRRLYKANPEGLPDVLILTPQAKVEQRRLEFPGIEVMPIQFNSGELGAESWKFLLGAFGNDSLYVRQLIAIMRKYRQGLTLATFEQEIRDAQLTPAARRLAEDRINLARPYINDAASLGGLLRPGRTVIVDLRDEWIEKDEALGLFVVMMKIFATSRFHDRDFNKLVVFDEAHKYITESELISQVVETIREMRHQATSVVIASQDPLSVPRAVVELTSILVLHRMTSPQWLKHLKSAIVALDAITDVTLSTLQPGEALVWAQRATDKRFSQRPQKITIRPRFSQHGGGTKTAIDGETVR